MRTPDKNKRKINTEGRNKEERFDRKVQKTLELMTRKARKEFSNTTNQCFG